MEMVRCRVAGMNIEAVVTQFKCSYDTVRRSLAYAAREGLMREYENQIIGDLIPAAIKVYQKKLLEEEDPYVAKHVLDIAMKLGDRFHASEMREAEAEKSLSDYLDELRENEDQDEFIDIGAVAPAGAQSLEVQPHADNGPQLLIAAPEASDGKATNP